MRMLPIALTLTIALTAATVAVADGAPRKWRAPLYARAGISYNVITPYYVNYFPTRYSYYRPDPVPLGYTNHPRIYRDGCWLAYEGEIWWGC
jgi:hypothetical protein